MIDGLRDIWDAVTRPIGQAITSAATFTVGFTNYFNYTVWHDALSLIGMIAGICVSVTLTALNVLRFVREWRGKRRLRSQGRDDE